MDITQIIFLNVAGNSEANTAKDLVEGGGMILIKVLVVIVTSAIHQISKSLLSGCPSDLRLMKWEQKWYPFQMKVFLRTSPCLASFSPFPKQQIISEKVTFHQPWLRCGREVEWGIQLTSEGHRT